MKITDIAALILAISTIARFLVRQEEDEPQIQGLCKACESSPAPCCAKPNPVPPANVRQGSVSRALPGVRRVYKVQLK